MSAQQLLPYTNAQYRLLQLANHLVKASFPQIAHSTSCLALSRKHHAIGLLQQPCIIGKKWFNA